MQFKKYYSAVKYLEALAATTHDKQYMIKHEARPWQYLERTREFARLLGSPQKGFKYIHISGTSGKGSTVAFLHQILRASGKRIGSFTSPYCSTSIEKIKVNDKLIDPIEFANIVDQVKPVIKKMEKEYKYGRPSYFEIFCAISLLYFKKEKCDWVILEVGCGGKYDAGNIIETSISATTNIGLDHTQVLGKTLPKIAKEKAGIIKPNSYFFTTEKNEQLLEIFKKICKEKKTKFHHIKTFGEFQDANKALAKSIAQHIGIKNDTINKAITNTQLPPCRFEIIQTNPTIILDGAHNPDKTKSVVHNLKNLTYGKLYTIFAASSTKDAQKMLNILLAHVDEIVFTEFKTADRNSYKASQLYKLAKKYKNKTIEKNSKKALAKCLKKIKTNEALLITGSLYLTGELRKYWVSEEQILKKRSIN